MYLKDFYERHRLDESLAQKVGFNPYYLEIASGLDGKILIKGRAIINLASNNYLGLAADQRVKQAIITAVEKYGASLCGTPVATGYIDLFRSLEEKLARFVGLEEAIIFPSCYQANNGLFVAIAGKEDLIVVDHFAHSSLIQGIKTVGCKIRPYLHNNLEHLKGILEKSSPYRQVFVVTESVFSTDGGIAPFGDIVELCKRYGAVPIVDDSHGLGVLGKRGKGILEEQDITGFQGIYTASLGKALANTGGIICGEKRLLKYLKYYCPHLVYSTALPPAVLAGIEAVLGIIEAEFPMLKGRLESYRRIISQSLKESGFEAAASSAPINSIHTGSKENTFAVTKGLFAKGILSTPFIEPAVPPNEGRVRLIAGANLTEDTINEAVSIIKGGF